MVTLYQHFQARYNFHLQGSRSPRWIESWQENMQFIKWTCGWWLLPSRWDDSQCFTPISCHPAYLVSHHPHIPDINRVFSCWLSICLGLLDPWRWDRYLVLKRQWRITIWCCIIPQNSAVLINITVEAWNQRYISLALLWKNSNIAGMLMHR
jgi:hypothetical protein